MFRHKKIENWLKKQGYGIEFRSGQGWQVDYQKKSVSGDLKIYKNKKDLIAVILHECGHIVQEEKNPKLACIKFPRLKKGKKASDSFYIDILKREIDAWDEAEILAKNLKIPNIINALKRMRSHCLMAYIHWAAEKQDISFLKP